MNQNSSMVRLGIPLLISFALLIGLFAVLMVLPASAGDAPNDPPSPLAPSALAVDCSIRRVSVAYDGTQGNGDSSGAAISADGRYVAFSSYADNLVADDTNEHSDVFVRDMLTGKITLVSVTSDGVQGNGNSWGPSLSADGRYVAFTSFASNLVEGDANDRWDVFVHDRETGETTLASVLPEFEFRQESDFASMSADGHYVAFIGDYCCLVTTDVRFGYVRDLQAGHTITAAFGLTRHGTGYVYTNIDSIVLSSDGRYVVFGTGADSVVVSDTNHAFDVFIRDWQTGWTERVSVASDGTQGNDDSIGHAVSADGRYVAFASRATNLVFSDTNQAYDVFVRDVQEGETTRVSVASDGSQAEYGVRGAVAISGNGRYVAFPSFSRDLAGGSGVNIYVHDNWTGITTRIYTGPEENNRSDHPAFSFDGRYLVFDSRSSNLVDGDTNNAQDVFICDGRGVWMPPVVYLPLVLRK